MTKPRFLFAVLMALLISVIASFSTAFAATEQQAEADKSWFLSFIESTLSAPNRIIRISDIDGALSSEASIGSITIADKQGVWLTLSDVKLNWSRLALLRGQVSVQSLTAGAIDIIRKPLAESSTPSPESGGFSLPQLPVSIIVEQLTAQKVHFGEALFDLDATITAQGSLNLADGKLQSKFTIDRLDDQGHFELLADYNEKGQKLDLDFTLNESKNGIVSNLLKIENRPPLDLSLKGKGSFSDLKMTLAMTAGNQPVLNGLFTITPSSGANRFNFSLSGPIAILMPEDYRGFFGSNTALNANGLIRAKGGMVLEDMSLKGAAIDIKASAETLADGFLRQLKVKGHIASETGAALILPVSGGTTKAQTITLDINYGSGDEWRGQFVIDALDTANFRAADVTLDMGGLTQNLDNAASRHVTINMTGGVHEIATHQADIAKALGHAIALKFNADISAQKPVTISDFNVNANGFALWLQGQLNGLIFNGHLGLNAESLAPISLFTDTPVSGAVNMSATGIIRLSSGAFNLTLDGATHTIKTNNATLDNLLKGDVKLSGAIQRDSNGFSTRQFKLGSEEVALYANGRFASRSADMDFSLKLSDLSLIAPRAKGPIDITGSARGNDNLIAIGLRLSALDNTLNGRALRNGLINVNVMLDHTSPIASYMSGAIDGSGSFADKPLLLSGQFANNNDGLRFKDLLARIGDATLSGTLDRDQNGLMDGAIHFDAPDLSTIAALALMDGKGTAQADIILKPQNGEQNANIVAHADGVVFGNTELTRLDVDAAIANLLGMPHIDGALKAQNIKISGFTVHHMDANANSNGNATDFTIALDAQDGLKANAKGRFSGDDSASQQLDLTTFDIARGDVTARLKNPASIHLSDQNIALSDMTLVTGSGSLSLGGTIGDTLDLKVLLNNLPLALANIAKPDLGAQGTLSGNATISGSKSAPDIGFTLQGKDMSVAQSRGFGLSPLTLKADGQTQNQGLNLQADVSGSGLHIAASGSLPMAESGEMDMTITLHDLPLALANGAVKGQDIAGKITGNAKISGSYSNPVAQFDINGASIRAAALTRSGVAPITIQAGGNFANNILNLDNMVLSGPKNLNLTARGRLPIAGDGIDFVLNGAAPLGIANQFLAERGAQASGTMSLNATVKGSLNNPLLDGSFKISDGTFIDTETNLRLKAITFDGALRGDQIVVNTLSAASSAGGSFSGKGAITVNMAEKLPANLAVTLQGFRYNDGKMVNATLSGTVTVTGALLKDPEIGGEITIDKAEIRIPDNFGGASMIDVEHKNAGKSVKQTLERAGVEEQPNAVPIPTERPSVPQLKMRIKAPNQFFIRGYGLDAEMGGGIGLMGPITDIKPIGGFNMIRGRFEILSQRLTFSEGQVTLVGNLDPQLYFVASTEGNDITVTVTISGTVETLGIKFSSSPELPQDEILAQLLFNRSIGELSAFQLAQLASAAAEMAGLTDTSLIGALRANTGLDDLDVTTDAQGNTGVKAGRYIRDNIYLGVEAGSGGNTKGTINLDITKSLKAKGAVGADGDSSVGVFYEKDY